MRGHSSNFVPSYADVSSSSGANPVSARVPYRTPKLTSGADGGPTAEDVQNEIIIAVIAGLIIYFVTEGLKK